MQKPVVFCKEAIKRKKNLFRMKKEMNKITMTLNVDHLIKRSAAGGHFSEDVTTNAVMKQCHVTGEE